MNWAWRYPQDPVPGRCDDGTFVECCTDIHGLTDCNLTTLGRWTPGAGFLLAQSLPDDDTDTGTLDRLLETANNLPNPLDEWKAFVTGVGERIPAVGELLEAATPNIKVDVVIPESLGFAAMVPAALFGLLVGGGIAWVVKK